MTRHGVAKEIARIGRIREAERSEYTDMEAAVKVVKVVGLSWL